MAIQWFYQSSEGRATGPLDSTELRRLAEAGIVRPETLVRQGAIGSWVCAEQVRGLFQRSAPAPSSSLEAFPLEPPPLPPPLPSAVPESVAPRRGVGGESPIRHGLGVVAVNEASEKPERIEPVTWAAIIVGSGSVLLLLWALVFRGGSTPQQQAEKDQPPLAVAKSAESRAAAPDWGAVIDAALGASTWVPATGNVKILELADLAELVGPSVVQVNVTGPEKAGTGSGFVLDKQGTIVTNYHVIEDATAGTIVFSDRTSAPITGYLGVWPEKDIALVRVECAPEKLHPLRLEAKPEGHTLTGVETQSAKYSDGLPAGLPHHRLPLPFAYESTGTVTQFTNNLEPDARSREVFTFHRPDELLRLVNLEEQLRGHLRHMPPLNVEGLWPLKITTLNNLETSLAANRPRSLIQMTMGSGKTLTAVIAAYRLIKFADAKRILFLVDRNNLGRQTYKEFSQYVSPYNGYKFTDEYNVQHLRRNTIDPASRVCITTIQRLYSMLKGEEVYDEANEEGSLFEAATSLVKEPLPVIYNERIPIETFDCIIVDECHRSIYNVWRQVLDYFDAFIIGLTATPTKQTIGYFNQNLVQEYTHEDAVADGVNVGYDVYRIATQITADGAKLVKKPEVFVPHRDRRTKKRIYKELDDDITYTGNQLDRDVVSEPQIRLIVQTFRDRLPTEIFPGRKEVPKTLVFAKNDLHADDIVKVIREEFGKGNEFCQKITSKSTGKKPEELLADFRNSYFPRIAVTVDMIATGTDVKPLECLLFMRNINSWSYFEQMKGRGSRVIKSDDLQSVTPDAKHKTHFVIVDAVGVCERDKTASKPLDRKPSVPLDKLLKAVAAGMVNDDVVSTLVARLSRLEQEIDDQQDQEIAAQAGGKSLATLCHELLDSIDPDKNVQLAGERFGSLDPVAEAPGVLVAEEGEDYAVAGSFEPTEEQLAEVERDRMQQALQPFHNPKLRDAILQAKQSSEQPIDTENPDQLLSAGFDAAALEKARTLVTTFRQFIEDNKDEIEALQVLYSRPHRQGLRYRHVKELAAALERPPLSASLPRLWQAYQAIEPERVKGTGGKQLVDVIALVRHAIDPNQLLCPIGTSVQERYDQWLADQTAAGVTFTPDQRRWLDAIKDHIATSLAIDRDDLEEVPFNQIGGLGRAYELFGEQLASLLEELNSRLAA